VAKTNHLGALAAAVGMLAAVGSLVLMLVVIEARPAEATFPGKNGKIAYQGFDGHDFEIYTIYPGRAGKFKVTNNKTDDHAPSYSPNGNRIVYAGFDGHDTEIYTIDRGGGGRVQLAHNSTDDSSPSWGGRP
jgi:TolB protein